MDRKVVAKSSLSPSDCIEVDDDEDDDEDDEDEPEDMLENFPSLYLEED